MSLLVAFVLVLVLAVTSVLALVTRLQPRALCCLLIFCEMHLKPAAVYPDSFMNLPLLAAAAWGALSPATPPPPPLTPGTSCRAEAVFTDATGSHDVQFATGQSPLRCSFVIFAPNTSQGLQVSFSNFDLHASGSCGAAEADHTFLNVFDHTTSLERMLARFSCRTHTPVASTHGALMMVLEAGANVTGAFTFAWSPASPSCGNGICENSADEYDLCAGDCGLTQMPSFSLQHHDTKWCDDYDRLLATSTSGQSVTIPYTLAHFGTRLPPDGLTLDLARVVPQDACSSITSVLPGGNVSSLAPGVCARAGRLKPIACVQLATRQPDSMPCSAARPFPVLLHHSPAAPPPCQPVRMR